MYNVSFKSRFRIVSLEKGTKNRKIFAEYGEGKSKRGIPINYLKMEKFRLYKKDVFGLSKIQHELFFDLFLSEKSRIKEYLKSEKKNILGLETCRITKYE